MKWRPTTVPSARPSSAAGSHLRKIRPVSEQTVNSFEFPLACGMDKMAGIMASLREKPPDHCRLQGGKSPTTRNRRRPACPPPTCWCTLWKAARRSSSAPPAPSRSSRLVPLRPRRRCPWIPHRCTAGTALFAGSHRAPADGVPHMVAMEGGAPTGYIVPRAELQTGHRTVLERLPSAQRG